MTKCSDNNDNERVPIIMNWLGYEGLHFIPTLTDKE